MKNIFHRKKNLGHISQPKLKIKLKSHKRKIVCFLLCVVVVCIGVGIYMYYIYGGKGDNVKYAPLAGEVRGNGEPILSISEFRFERFGEWVCVKGTMENISHDLISYIKIVVTEKDENSSFIDFSSGIAMNGKTLSPQQSTTYQRCMEDKEKKISFSESEISFKGKIGENFDDVELPYRIK